MDRFKAWGRPSAEKNLEQPSSSSTQYSRSSYRARSEPESALRSSIPSELRRDSSGNGSVTEPSYDIVLGTIAEKEDSTGLTIVHDVGQADGDIVFVHGLGGASHRTWSWNRDPTYFWPPWLSRETNLSKWRISTYGYNASIGGQDSVLNISDFAVDLLLSLVGFSNKENEVSTRFGNKPICFVCHSLGGLVVKRAFCIAKKDSNYSEIADSVKGIVFLSTPHKGSKHASLLNNILSAAPIGVHKKPYIEELDSHSISLQNITDEFQPISENLELVSVFETRKTRIAPGVSTRLVERNEGVLGFPRERRYFMEADHHSVCKYKSTGDPNYTKVKQLISLVTKAGANQSQRPIPHRRMSLHAVMNSLADIFGIAGPPKEDLDLYRSRLMAGTCQWFVLRASFKDWLRVESSSPRVLCLTGLPASGKSTISSFVTEQIQNSPSEVACFYYFFSHASPEKRSTAHFLRSVAFQLAQFDEDFRHRLQEYYHDTRVELDKQKASFLWDTIFVKIFDEMVGIRTCFLVVDALDEAESPQSVLRYLKKFYDFECFRIMIVSRPTQELRIMFGDQAIHEKITNIDTSDDIRKFVTDYVRKTLPEDTTLSSEIVEDVLAKANGSFLWVRLVLERIKDEWHVSTNLQDALTQIPSGMDALYVSMVNTLNSQETRQRDIGLEIILWAACAYRPLRIDELEEALRPNFGSFTYFEESIARLCGHFTKSDDKTVLLTHETATEFLFGAKGPSPVPIDREKANTNIAITCIKSLCNREWKRIFKRYASDLDTISTEARKSILLQDHPFYFYAAKYWTYHLVHGTPNSPELFQALRTFFGEYCLSWIDALSLLKNLRPILKAAAQLKTFVRKAQRRKYRKSVTNSQLHDLDYVSSWAGDLNHLVGKFGSHLINNPNAIYKRIPAFCPRGSIIGKTYGGRTDSFSIAGTPGENWDDCIARLDTGENKDISQVYCTEKYILTLIGVTGELILWYADTFERAGSINHEDETVRMIAINFQKTHVVTVGPHSIQLWDLATQQQINGFKRGFEQYPKAILFDRSDKEILLGFDDCTIVCRNLRNFKIQWTCAAEDPDQEHFDTPKVMEFSPDGHYVALAFRGRPVQVFDLLDRAKSVPRQYVRDEDRYRGHDEVLNAVDAILWTPDCETIIVLYQDMQLVLWRLFDETKTEFSHVRAREMKINDDGTLLITGDSKGSLNVWILPKLHLLYKVNYESFIRDLAFSPDSHRVLDARGSTCHIWEPDVLAQSEEEDEDDQISVSESSLETTAVIANTDHGLSQLTCVACDSRDDYYFCGRDNGFVSIHDMTDGSRLKTLYPHPTEGVSVIALECSSNLKFVASADDDGCIIVKRLKFKEQHVAVFPCIVSKVQNWTQQLLFSRNERHLLVYDDKGYQIWDLKTKVRIEERSLRSCGGGRWINHPSEEAMIVWLEIKNDNIEITVRPWVRSDQNLTLPQSPGMTITPISGAETTLDLDSSSQRSSVTISDGVYLQWIEPANDNAQLIYRATSTIPGSGLHIMNGFEIGTVPISSISASAGTVEIPRSRLFDEDSEIFYFLGIRQGRMIYIDKQHCLCSQRLDAEASSKRLHCYLPKDWMSQLCSRPALLSSLGAFLRARGRNLAIVRYDMYG